VVKKVNFYILFISSPFFSLLHYLVKCNPPPETSENSVIKMNVYSNASLVRILFLFILKKFMLNYV